MIKLSCVAVCLMMGISMHGSQDQRTKAPLELFSHKQAVFFINRLRDVDSVEPMRAFLASEFDAVCDMVNKDFHTWVDVIAYIPESDTTGKRALSLAKKIFSALKRAQAKVARHEARKKVKKDIFTVEPRFDEPDETELKVAQSTHLDLSGLRGMSLSPTPSNSSTESTSSAGSNVSSNENKRTSPYRAYALKAYYRQRSSGKSIASKFKQMFVIGR